jgi:pimeloyl-ACP methyl ester carboxylesterase
MKNVMLIHGAWSSGSGFNHIEQNIDRDVYYFKYDCNKEKLPDIVDRARKELRENTVIVGHSLGGIIALALHDELNCSRIVTLSAPLAGITIHPLWDSFVVARAPILNMIERESYFMKDLRKKKYSKIIHSFITTRGFNPFIIDKSDGIVSIRAQDSWLPPTAFKTYIDCNHFEILQEKEVQYIIDWYTR